MRRAHSTIKSRWVTLMAKKMFWMTPQWQLSRRHRTLSHISIGQESPVAPSSRTPSTKTVRWPFFSAAWRFKRSRMVCMRALAPLSKRMSRTSCSLLHDLSSRRALASACHLNWRVWPSPERSNASWWINCRRTISSKSSRTRRSRKSYKFSSTQRMQRIWRSLQRTTWLFSTRFPFSASSPSTWRSRRTLRGISTRICHFTGYH